MASTMVNSPHMTHSVKLNGEGQQLFLGARSVQNTLMILSNMVVCSDTSLNANSSLAFQCISTLRCVLLGLPNLHKTITLYPQQIIKFHLCDTLKSRHYIFHS